MPCNNVRREGDMFGCELRKGHKGMCQVTIHINWDKERTC